MSMLRRILSRGRLRKARRELARSPSSTSFAALAQQYAWAGEMREALRVAQEGLAASPGHPDLQRLVTRLARVQQEDLLAELREELREAPRPAVWNELCEVLLESREFARVEETAAEWFRATCDPEAKLMIASARLGTYFADRDREAGRRVFSALDEVEALLKRDLRPLKLRLQLATRIGAWNEARRVVRHMLELEPGDLALEARFRSLQAMPEDAPDVERALIHVERTGSFAEGDEDADATAVPVGELRPLLQKLAARDSVRAGVYVRGSTALVQGLRGAQAERVARSVRGVLQSGRAAARSLGLGQISSVEMEGGFGQLFLAAGELDAGALWCQSTVKQSDRAELWNMLGVSPSGGQSA